MTQDHNQDGQFPSNQPEHGSPQPGEFNPSHTPQPTSDDSWLMDDAGALEASAMESAPEPTPEPEPFGSPPVAETGWEADTEADTQVGAESTSLGDTDGGDSWLMSGEGDLQESPGAQGAAPVAGDGPTMLEAEYVSSDPVGSARALLVPVTLGAIALLGGFALLRMGSGGGADQDAPEPVAVTGDLYSEPELVDPSRPFATPTSSEEGTRRAIGRDGQFGAAVPQGKQEQFPRQGAGSKPVANNPVSDTQTAPESMTDGTSLVADAGDAANMGTTSSDNTESSLDASSVPGIDLAELVLSNPLGPLGPLPPAPTWDSIPSSDEIELASAVNKPGSDGDRNTGEEVASVESDTETVDTEAELLAWLESDTDLPFVALGYATAAPEMVAPEVAQEVASVEAEPAPDPSETQAAVALEPAPSVSVEPSPSFVAGMPLTLEPLWPGFELESVGSNDLFYDDLQDEFLDELMADSGTELESPWETEEEAPQMVAVETEVFVFIEENLLLPEAVALPGKPLPERPESPEDGFYLGADPVQWSAERELLAQAVLDEELDSEPTVALDQPELDIPETDSTDITELVADAEVALETDVEVAPELPAELLAELTGDATGEATDDAIGDATNDVVAEVTTDVEAEVETEATAEMTVEAPETGLAEFAELLAEAEAEELSEVETLLAQKNDMPTVEVDVLPGMESSMDETVETVDPMAVVVDAPSAPVSMPKGPVAKLPEPEPRTLLQAYSDWMRIQDMAPAAAVVASGLSGVPGHENLPYGLAQLASGDSFEANTLDLGVEIGQSQAPRRGGVLRRASGDHRWDGIEVPDHAVSVGRKLLTPNVGPVRVVLVDGENLEGRLHAVGFDMVWLETSLGRMSLEQRRVDQIVKLDPRHVVTAPGAKRDYSRFPRVRVTAKGGIFVGHQLSRTDDRITLVTDEGSRITLENVEVMPARQFRSVGLIRQAGEASSEADTGSPASPK